LRIAWTGPAEADRGGVAGMGIGMVRELLRQGVEIDLYLNPDHGSAPPVAASPGLRVITRRVRWEHHRWYSRTKPTAFFTSLVCRGINGVLLSVRLLVEHRRRPYDAVFQLSQMELLLLGRLRRWAPPIVVHPCTHAAGELRWHRAEQRYALRAERRIVHFAMRAWLTVRSRNQPRELERADLVVGPSERYVELLHQDYGVPREKLRVLRHPVDLERFTPAHPSLRSQPLTLLFVSRISARKGVEDVIALSHRLADLAGGVRLLVVGGPTLWSDYTAHLADLHPAVAEFIGGVTAADMPALLRQSAMVLVPSRYEPGSLVTGEALASGAPVVLSDEVGPVEVVAGPHARTHRAGDVDELEAAVRSLLATVQADDDGALAASARANAEEQFAVGPLMSQLIDLITTLNQPAAQPTPASTAASILAEGTTVRRAT
jgi:glycosyltransferase involved in cell wall biosynthesis